MVYNKIAKLFPTDRLDLCIGRAKTRHIERILSASEFEKWRMASVKERIEKTAMDLIMSNVKTGRTLTCARDAQFPVNYHHDKVTNQKVSILFIIFFRRFASKNASITTLTGFVFTIFFP